MGESSLLLTGPISPNFPMNVCSIGCSDFIHLWSAFLSSHLLSPSLLLYSPTSPSSSPLAFLLLLPRSDLLTILNVLLRGALLAVYAHSNLISFPQYFPWVAISFRHSPLSSGPVNSSRSSFGLCPVIGRHICLVCLGCHCCLPDVACLLLFLLPEILSTNWLLRLPPFYHTTMLFPVSQFLIYFGDM